MDGAAPEVARLAEEREAARRARDFARADALRAEIDALGWEVRDTPQGPVLSAKPAYRRLDPAAIPSVLDEPAETTFSVHLLYEGFPDDLRRFLDGLQRHTSRDDFEVVVVDNASDDGALIEEIAAAHPKAAVLHLDRAVGWAAARNAGLKTSRGAIIVLADLSVEPEGDVLTPIEDALRDSSVGLAGPIGIVTDDLREFEASDGPEVDAIEGYLMGVRRDLLARGGLIDEKFRWYRNADIDLSFQIRSLGARAVVAPCPIARHTHRGWSAVPEDERPARSRKNFNRFLARWGARTDLLVRNAKTPPARS